MLVRRMPVPGLLLLLALLSPALLQAQEKKEVLDPQTCAVCHEDLAAAFVKNRHTRVKQSCQACHAGAEKHADSGDPGDVTNPANLTGLAGDKACLGCHQNQQTQLGRIRGGHARSTVNCSSCHSVHKPKAVAAAANCGSCHASTVAEFQKPYRHRLQEGGVNCTSCHNPHGRTLSHNLAAVSANEPGCMNCHGNLRGPFVFQHAPVRQEGCAACHEPHGSVNPRMLTRAEVHLQCLECHSSGVGPSAAPGGTPPAFHNLRDPRIRNCTVCHVKVHGSHVNRALIK
jgi:DmsE family decaheme c-type cytochrome